MASVRSRPNGKLFFDFRYQGVRCREQTTLVDSPANRKKLEAVLAKIEAEITLNTFDYAKYFPQSKNLGRFKSDSSISASRAGIPLFSVFAEEFMAEKNAEWRASHKLTQRSRLDNHLNPTFGNSYVNAISKADILKFRAALAQKSGGRKGKPLSASMINHAISLLNLILAEAAERYDFDNPCTNIKSLKVPRTQVFPFTLDEVQLILSSVRPDFRSYFTVRFFAGLRSAEIDGLKWEYIDFDRREILIRETIVRGNTEYTKNDGSMREVLMSPPVYEALKAQYAVTHDKSEYVFCARNGAPLLNRNVTRRVWYPLLRYLGLKMRNPYQSRHTAATLWLASGESPEWIARQMGHTTTEMLFRVYSRYVPNLTRNDGSAMERLLASRLQPSQDAENNPNPNP